MPHHGAPAEVDSRPQAVSRAGTDPASSPAPPAAGKTVSAAAVPERAAQQYDQSLQLMKAGRYRDAEAALKAVSAEYPELAGPHLNLGLIYERDGRLSDAETELKAAMERNSASSIAGNELGVVERKLGKFADAEALYQRTIAADPGYAPTYLNLGVLYDLYLAEPQKALEQFEHYLQLAGENKKVTGWVAELRKRVGAAAPAGKKEPA